MSACTICFNLRPESLEKLPQGQRAIMFIQLSDIKTSASKAPPCPECALVWNALSLYKKDWTGTNYSKYVELVIAIGKPIRVNWHDDLIQIELFSGFKDNNTTENTESKRGIIGPADHVSEHSGADKCFQLASSWLESCTTSHTSCFTSGESKMPTRLLYVGSQIDQKLSLADTQGRTGRYAALSYCWGTQQERSFETTAQAIQKARAGIEFRTLSKTIQDAVTICRRLQIEYLWVDALCIIQGDPEDWVRESSRMSQVYLNACVTIIADNSAGCSKGIFSKQIYGIADQKIPYKDGKLVSVRKPFAQEHNRSELAATVLGEAAEPVACRAWCLQEALLSNRRLHYTTKELVWECNEAWYCECGNASGKKDLDDEEEFNLRDATKVAKLPIDRIHDQWEEIVMRYTERALTDTKDKFPALSGLASQYGKVLQLVSGSESPEQYLTGLWRSTLIKSLRWTVEDDMYRPHRQEKHAYQRSKVWRAPTWSWACIDGPIYYAPMVRFTPDLDVVEALATPSTVDVFGQVSKAQLVVTGRVMHSLPVEVIEPVPEDHFAGFSNGLRFVVRYQDGQRTFLIDDLDDFHGGQAGITDVSVTCLLLGHIVARGSHVVQEEVFVVLRPASPSTVASASNERVFERVGASLRAYQETTMATWGKTSENSGSAANVVRLFDTAPRETITII